MTETFERVNDHILKRTKTTAYLKEELLSLEHLDRRQTDLEAQLTKLPTTKRILQEGLKEINAIRAKAIAFGIVVKPILKEEIDGRRINKMVRI